MIPGVIARVEELEASAAADGEVRNCGSVTPCAIQHALRHTVTLLARARG